MNLASVSRRVAPARRRASLGWSIHAEVAKLEPEQQVEWLDRAEREGLTVEELRGLLRPDTDLTTSLELVPASHDSFGAAVRELRVRHGDRLTPEKLIAACDERLAVDETVGALFSSVSDEWWTPAEYVEAARATLGGIDLDPASCPEANETVKAARFFTVADDGLAQDWHGRVFVNAPFSLSSRFVRKLQAEYSSGHVTAAVLVLNGNRFDANWFQPLWEFVLCCTDHRPRFRNPAKPAERPTGGTAFVYLGPEPEKFAAAFGPFGAVVHRVTDACALEAAIPGRTGRS
jgi:ParB family chromosome partitioning protein